ncbi:MAG TPA: MarR family transcriptional regulator [Galbitalea sp.]|jgi:DNA-binding MarR family transcriptional regulator|nr:MarR family transcriptional regulator [Galbitalea sp.]
MRPLTAASATPWKTPSTGGGFGYLLMHAAQTWRVEASRVLQSHKLTVPQFLVVMALYRQARHDWPPLKQTEVATRLGMDANTTSQIVRGLEQRSLLTRTPNRQDARARALALTPTGVAHARAASAAVRAMNDTYFAVIPADQLALLGDILITLSAESKERS